MLNSRVPNRDGEAWQDGQEFFEVEADRQYRQISVKPLFEEVWYEQCCRRMPGAGFVAAENNKRNRLQLEYGKPDENESE